jgi:hypothetical protein
MEAPYQKASASPLGEASMPPTPSTDGMGYALTLSTGPRSSVVTDNSMVSAVLFL